MKHTSLGAAAVTKELEGAGCVAAAEEAEELIRVATDDRHLRDLLGRRTTGEPLAWITGTTRFCGVDVAVEPGVFVPRWQSEALAEMAATLLPSAGRAVDLCTGSGAVGLVMRSARPGARVVATEVDAVAAGCARRNGLEVYEGHLDRPLPEALAGRVDVMTGVLPYVPHDALGFLPRDVQAFEPRRALDGGPDGLDLVRDVVRRSPRWVASGGWLLLEVGGDQISPTAALFEASGYTDVATLVDDDGDQRGVYGCLAA